MKYVLKKTNREGKTLYFKCVDAINSQLLTTENIEEAFTYENRDTAMSNLIRYSFHEIEEISRPDYVFEQFQGNIKIEKHLDLNEHYMIFPNGESIVRIPLSLAETISDALQSFNNRKAIREYIKANNLENDEDAIHYVADEMIEFQKYILDEQFQDHLAYTLSATGIHFKKE